MGLMNSLAPSADMNSLGDNMSTQQCMLKRITLKYLNPHAAAACTGKSLSPRQCKSPYVVRH